MTSSVAVSSRGGKILRLGSLLFLAGALAAQSQTGEVTTREETPTFQSSVNLVRVPVVIRDKQGKIIGTFRKEDFRLTDRGKPQEIAQFALEGSAFPKAPKPAGAEAPGEPPSKMVVPSRFVALVFDDVHLTLDDLMNVRAAALKQLEPGIPPQERIALLTLSGAVSLEFTNDAAKIREKLMKIMPVPPHTHFPPASFYAADQFMRNPGDEQASCHASAGGACPVVCDPMMPQVLQMQTFVTVDCLPLDCQQAAAATPIARATLRAVFNEGASEAQNAFRTLNNVVRLLGSMPGDRVMILISPGMYLPDELQRSLNESIDRATRSGVIINTLDGRGVYTVDPAGEVPNCRLTDQQTQIQVARYNLLAISAQGLILHDLADSTGGTAISDNDFLGGLNRLANPPEYVYYLGFYPRDLKPDGKFHEIKVTLANGQGLAVQARKGYWAPSHVEDAATAATREIGEAVFSHDDIRDLPIDVDTQFYKTSAADARLRVSAHLDIRQLHLLKQDDLNRDNVTMVCALFDSNGNYLKGVQKVVELRVKDENVERRRDRGLTMNSDFEVKSGAYMIRVVARDTEGQQMAAANDTVEIP